MVFLTPIERETLQFFVRILQMLIVSTFGNTVEIYALVHLVPHACRHITVDGHSCYYCPLAANQGNYVRVLFLKKTWRTSLSIGVRITMIHCVVYLLRIFKMFHGLMNNPVCMYVCMYVRIYLCIYIYIYIYIYSICYTNGNVAYKKLMVRAVLLTTTEYLVIPFHVLSFGSTFV
jgi:hypothetical protein